MPVSRRAAAASAAVPAARPATTGGHQTLPQSDDDLLREGDEVPALPFQLVEHRDARERIALGERVHEALDGRLRGQAQQVAHQAGIDDRIGRGEDLVEQRFGVAHAARGEPRDELQGVGVGDAALGRQDAPELALDLLDGQGSEREALEAGHDRRSDLAGVRGAEDEQHAVGRLLEGLEQDVPALLDALDLIDDEHLAAQVGGRRVDARHELAHVIDPVVGCRVELDDVHRPALPDGDAGGARVARLAVAQVGAVDRLGEDARRGRLARPAGADEQQPMAQPIHPDGVLERLHDRPLADHLAERLGAESPIDRLVGGAGDMVSTRRWVGARGHPVRIAISGQVGLPCTLCRPKTSVGPPE